MPYRLEHAKRCRNRAEELRSLAEGKPDSEAAMLLEQARHYEKMAEELERRARKDDCTEGDAPEADVPQEGRSRHPA